MNTDTNYYEPTRWPVSSSGLRAVHDEARVGLVFPTVPELVTATPVPIPLRSSQASHVDLVDLPPPPPVG